MLFLDHRDNSARRHLFDIGRKGGVFARFFSIHTLYYLGMETSRLGHYSGHIFVVSLGIPLC